MTGRPILFSGPMVRAILGGRKTMTRRVVKHKPFYGKPDWDGAVVDNCVDCQYLRIPQDGGEYGDSVAYPYFCPYGVPGDTLWVRESWTRVPQSAYWHDSSVPHCRDGEDWIIYRAGWERSDPGVGWRPSIHMPRWASRITLEVKSVRVERVRSITEEDALAEGVTGELDFTPQMKFAELWNSINRKRGYGWDANPWVWVVEFERKEQA